MKLEIMPGQKEQMFAILTNTPECKNTHICV